MALPKKVKRVETGIFKLEDGRWLVEFRPGGRDSKQFRKIKDTLADAKQSKQTAITRYQNREPLTPAKDSRTLSDLAKEWFNYHGHTLATGERRLLRLEALATALGNPRGVKCTPIMFLDYRKKRLADGVTEKNLNHELGYLKAVFNELQRAGAWLHEKPFDKIKKLRVPSKALHFLELEEIKRLLEAAAESRNPDLLTQIKICLSTGARYGEACGLHAEHVRQGKVSFIDTKNGRNRTVPISAELEAEIIKGRPDRGPLFPTSSWKAFEGALERAKIILPKGQRTHVMRHTFASHFMMNGGDFLVLNKILGHETIQMTMVYAHLAPDHLEDARNKNPLVCFMKPNETAPVPTSCAPEDNSIKNSQKSESLKEQ